MVRYGSSYNMFILSEHFLSQARQIAKSSGLVRIQFSKVIHV